MTVRVLIEVLKDLKDQDSTVVINNEDYGVLLEIVGVEIHRDGRCELKAQE